MSAPGTAKPKEKRPKYARKSKRKIGYVIMTGTPVPIFLLALVDMLGVAFLLGVPYGINMVHGWEEITVASLNTLIAIVVGFLAINTFLCLYLVIKGVLRRVKRVPVQ